MVTRNSSYKGTAMHSSPRAAVWRGEQSPCLPEHPSQRLASLRLRPKARLRPATIAVSSSKYDAWDRWLVRSIARSPDCPESAVLQHPPNRQTNFAGCPEHLTASSCVVTEYMTQSAGTRGPNHRGEGRNCACRPAQRSGLFHHLLGTRPVGQGSLRDFASLPVLARPTAVP
jgi:hypothetical protein